VVKHGVASHTFEFADTASNSSKVQWAAFFSDCEHEVRLVEGGKRITLAYQIVTKSGKIKTNWKLNHDLYKYYLCSPGPAAPAKASHYQKIYDNMKGITK